MRMHARKDTQHLRFDPDQDKCFAAAIRCHKLLTFASWLLLGGRSVERSWSGLWKREVLNNCCQNTRVGNCNEKNSAGILVSLQYHRGHLSNPDPCALTWPCTYCHKPHPETAELEPFQPILVRSDPLGQDRRKWSNLTDIGLM